MQCAPLFLLYSWAVARTLPIQMMLYDVVEAEGTGLDSTFCMTLGRVTIGETVAES